MNTEAGYRDRCGEGQRCRSNGRRASQCATIFAGLALCATLAVDLRAQIVTLHSFDYADGEYPYVGLVQGTDGNLYGTAYYGGANGAGTVYKMSAGGMLTTLYNFCSQTGCTDGENPEAGLVQGANGSFYGTTNYGGTYGYGTVFKISSSGTLTILHSFDSIDGANPYGGITLGADGNFYGTTGHGGANGSGTVYKIAPSGMLTTLHNFDGTDGNYCNAPPVQGADGNFYGTTTEGGLYGEGSVFKITAAGSLTTLHSFCPQSGCADGAQPAAPLAQGTDGNLYGTTEYGGANLGCSNGCGTVFRITPSGMLTTLHTFYSLGICGDGEFPYAPLTQGTDGNFYGTTYYGGGDDTDCEFGCGTIFRINLRGSFLTVASFDYTDGAFPFAGLIQDTNGSFYGTTSSGGAGTECLSNCGTVFTLSEGLGPFVETEPTSGKVGAIVKILGTNLVGATSVTFNGTPATSFTVNGSGSLITTTVPAGATTGTVQVTTPHGTLNSNVVFRVRP